MIYEANQPSFQAGRLVVIYHDFRNPRSASTASTNRITGAVARWGRKNRTKLTIIMLPASFQGQSSIKKLWAVRHLHSKDTWAISVRRLCSFDEL